MTTEADIVQRVLSAKGNALVIDQLIADYLPFIKGVASKACGRIVGNDDELSIAMLAFHEAIGGYDQQKGAFLKYAELIIKRKIIDFQRKEKRHSGQVSLDKPLNDSEDASMLDLIADQSDQYQSIAMRDATRDEIMELTAQLAEFDLSLSDIADNCPKQDRTFAACQKAIAYARQNPDLICDLKQSGRLPLAKLVAGAGIERKTAERHRKYIMALMLIYSNGYEIIRGHLKQVLSR